MPESQPLTSYHKLAELYDHLMEDAPYEDWMAYTLKAWNKVGLKPDKVADLGCGTGTLLRLLLEYGVEAYGVDLSPGMIEATREKLQRSHPGGNVHLLCQDIQKLSLPEQMDSVLSYCDTINYIVVPEGVQQVFRQVYQCLKPGGLFIFDVHTPYKVEQFFGNETFTDTDPEVSYIWDCHYQEETREVAHKLTFFVQEQGEWYRRYEEIHHQRAYLLEDLTRWLGEAGFRLLSLTGDFTMDPVEEESERAFFVAQRVL